MWPPVGGGIGRDFLGVGASVGLACYATYKLTNDQLGPVASVLVRGKNVSTAWGPRPRSRLPRRRPSPTEQVIGGSIKTTFDLRDGKPVLVRLPEVNFVDDKAGKPVGINSHIGRRPIAAFGNSDGDFEMLEWATGAPGPRLGLIVHHDDAEREWAYDRESPFGRLNRGLDEAAKRGWTRVSMKRDWRRIFAEAP